MMRMTHCGLTPAVACRKMVSDHGSQLSPKTLIVRNPSNASGQGNPLPQMANSVNTIELPLNR